MAKTTLRDMRAEVEGCRLFAGNSVFSEWKGRGNALYTVYSYGYHFPMYVFDEAIGEWIGNEDKYSVTTSKHQGKCRPNNVRYWLSTEALKDLIQLGGFVQYKTAREV
jgi:hypothetical protein